ncbi:hypothetical protein Q7356_06825, partial [Glaesserella parasuis]|nr:hypothetical protein [Glaesserella parasuis]MDP0090271.1 hypothetical protein [Glaesserella parasuis]
SFIIKYLCLNVLSQKQVFTQIVGEAPVPNIDTDVAAPPKRANLIILKTEFTFAPNTAIALNGLINRLNP